MIDDNFAINQLKELHETINILTNGSETLIEDIKRLSTESVEYENNLQHLTETVSNLKVAVEEGHCVGEALVQNLKVLNQDLVSLQEKIDDIPYVSNDGTIVWKITNIRDKLGMYKYFNLLTGR
ncbi:unnamed protein product [Rotaria sp. Silwood1]|nr:unnamed protein product [Rotaria sp. Silwood1]